MKRLTEYQVFRVTPRQKKKIRELMNRPDLNINEELRAFIDLLYDRITNKTLNN